MGKEKLQGKIELLRLCNLQQTACPNISICLQPFPYACFCALAAGAADGKPFCYNRFWAEFFDVAFAPAHAASFVGAEGEDFFAGKVCTLQKGEDGLGHGSPPAGIAQNDCVVAGNVGKASFECGAFLCPAFGGGNFGVFLVVYGIFLYGLDLKEVSASCFLGEFCYNCGISFAYITDLSAEVVFPNVSDIM